MTKLQFTSHLLNRIKLRKIEKKLVFNVVKSPDSILYDTLNNSLIGIKRIKEKYYMVAFLRINEIVKIITSHPIKFTQIKNRIKNKRWIKYEKDN